MWGRGSGLLAGSPAALVLEGAAAVQSLFPPGDRGTPSRRKATPNCQPLAEGENKDVNFALRKKN